MVEPTITFTGIVEKTLVTLCCLLAVPQFTIYNLQFSINLKISNFKLFASRRNLSLTPIFQIRHGFTLIEMMVVLSVIGIVATISFYGLNSYKNVQPVENAQREFLSHMRALQNQANNGADRQNFKVVSVTNGGISYGYTNPGQTDPNASLLSMNLPTGVAISQNVGAVSGQICFANPNKTAYTATSAAERCGLCVNGGAGYAAFGCMYNGSVYSIITSGSVEFSLSKGNVTKKVIVEGSGMRVTRIYAQ